MCVGFVENLAQIFVVAYKSVAIQCSPLPDVLSAMLAQPTHRARALMDYCCSAIHLLRLLTTLRFDLAQQSLPLLR